MAAFGLTKKQERLVEAVVSGEATSGVEAVRIAGYEAKSLTAQGTEASRTFARPAVQEALRAAFADAGGVENWSSRLLRKYAEDSTPTVRSSSVRSVELVMRATGLLNADVQVNVDARTALLPQSLDLDALARTLAGELAAPLELTDAEASS